MSILIKNMDMPTNCMGCPFKGFDIAGGRGNICSIDDSITLHAILDGIDVKFVRMGDCPLVPLPLPFPHEWIPCSERMPNPNELNGDVLRYYLVQNVFGDMLVCNWDGKEWGLIYSHEFEMPEDVVAWMPLPEQYKDERKEE